MIHPIIFQIILLISLCNHSMKISVKVKVIYYFTRCHWNWKTKKGNQSFLLFVMSWIYQFKSYFIWNINDGFWWSIDYYQNDIQDTHFDLLITAIPVASFSQYLTVLLPPLLMNYDKNKIIDTITKIRTKKSEILTTNINFLFQWKSVLYSR